MVLKLDLRQKWTAFWRILGANVQESLIFLPKILEGNYYVTSEKFLPPFKWGGVEKMIEGLNLGSNSTASQMSCHAVHFRKLIKILSFPQPFPSWNRRKAIWGEKERILSKSGTKILRKRVISACARRKWRLAKSGRRDVSLSRFELICEEN